MRDKNSNDKWNSGFYNKNLSKAVEVIHREKIRKDEDSANTKDEKKAS